MSSATTTAAVDGRGRPEWITRALCRGRNPEVKHRLGMEPQRALWIAKRAETRGKPTGYGPWMVEALDHALRNTSRIGLLARHVGADRHHSSVDGCSTDRSNP